MRTIKFKAKRVDNNEWVYGSLVGNDRPLIIGTHLLIDDNKGRKIIEMKATDICLVDPETVCQFTGLHDKNGTEIYKGDILMSSEPLELNGATPKAKIRFNVPQRVFYADGAFKIAKSNAGKKRPLNSLVIRVNGAEVIGNIHDK